MNRRVNIIIAFAALIVAGTLLLAGLEAAGVVQ